VVLPRALTVLLGTAALVVTAAGIAAAAWLVGPVFLALVVVIMVSPVQQRLRRLGWPAWATVVVLLATVYGLLLLLSATVVISLARLVTALTGYAAEANALLASALAGLARFGVGLEQLRAVLSSVDANRLVPLLTGLLVGLGGLAANLVFLLTLLLFLIAESSGAGARLAALSADRAPVARALSTFARGTRRFIGVTTVIGLATGLVDAVILWLLGVPLAALWGVLVFLTNYIPYLGFWIGLVPPAILALLVGGWPLLLVVLAVFLVVNFVLTSLVQPHYVGDAVDLSVTVVLLSLVFWAWLLGPAGAVLAVPLTLFVKCLLVDLDPDARWAATWLASGRARAGHTGRPRQATDVTRRS
jgi:predicted PurR-regulated permease PerM